MVNKMTIPKDIDVHEYRKPENPADEIFIKRWSARAMSGEGITDEELMTLFEAAKWAPSSSNDQPWRFIYAKHDTRYWDTFFSLLTAGNKRWCGNAAVLVVIASKKKFTNYDTDNRTHSFSAGSAFENLALQGSMMGLIVHGMGGFDEKKAAKDLNVPGEYFINAMIAIGRPGEIERLDEEDRKREMPSTRKPLKEVVFEGKFE